MRSRARLLLLGAGAALALGIVAPSPGLRDDADASSGNRAGVVVRSGDGEVRHRCVTFGEPEITGWELLQRSGFNVESRSFGTRPAVCSIDGGGCSSGDCWCEYPTFWGYWTREANADWRMSSVGASDRKVRDRSVDGWSWGRNGEPAPPQLPFSEICQGTSGSTRTPAPPTAPPAATAPAPVAMQPPAPAVSPTGQPGSSGAGSQDQSSKPADTTEPDTSPTPRPSPAANPTSPPEREVAQPDSETVSSSSYLAFVLFLVAFAVAGAAAVLARRRRTN